MHSFLSDFGSIYLLVPIDKLKTFQYFFHKLLFYILLFIWLPINLNGDPFWTENLRSYIFELKFTFWSFLLFLWYLDNRILRLNNRGKLNNRIFISRFFILIKYFLSID